MSAHALTPGTMLRQYRIDAVLGQGGFGITYLAYDTDLKRKVAIKECFPRDFVARDGATVVPTAVQGNADYKWALDKFIDEATTLARFRHPGIVQVLQILKEENDTAYMVLEFVDGQSLDDWLKELDRTPTEDELLTILTPLVEALQVVHENNIVHRDIAPDNIYIRSTGEAVLLDFGAAKQIFGQHSRTMNMIVKDGYSAPEQYYAEGRQGPWTDIYALAAVIYRAVIGKRPIDAMARLDAINNGDPDPLTDLSIAKPAGFSVGFLSALMHGVTPQAKLRPQKLSNWAPDLLGPDYQADSATPSSIVSSARSSSGPASRVSKAKPAPASRTDKPAQDNKSKMIGIAAALIIAVGGGGAWMLTQQSKAAEETAWTEAQAQDSADAYSGFLDSHPNSDFAPQAREAISAIRAPWIRTIGTSGSDEVQAVAATADRIYIAGSMPPEGGGGATATVIALSHAGRSLWTARLTGDGVAVPHDIMITPTDQIMVAGEIRASSSARPKGAVWMLEPDGTVAWSHQLDRTNSSLRALTRDASGAIVAAGTTGAGPRGRSDGVVIALSVNDGTVLWQRYAGGAQDDAIRDITLDANGALSFVGRSASNFWISKQSSEGHMTFNRTPGGNGVDIFNAVAAASDGALIVVGDTRSFGTGSVDGMFMRVGPDGKMPPKLVAENGDDHFNAVTLTRSGDVLIGGATSSRGRGRLDGWLRLHSPDLDQVNWERHYGGSGSDRINDVAILPDDSIVAVGSTTSDSKGGPDMWILRLMPDGSTTFGARAW